MKSFKELTEELSESKLGDVDALASYVKKNPNKDLSKAVILMKNNDMKNLAKLISGMDEKTKDILMDYIPSRLYDQLF
jgi:predicted CopG family antitoxin